MRLRSHIPMHRLSGLGIVAVVALVTLVAGVGGVLASAATSTVPTYPAGAITVVSPNPSATPGVWPNTVQTQFGTIPLPPGFRVRSQSDQLVEISSTTGHGRVRISRTDQDVNADNATIIQQIINNDRTFVDPNAQVCADDAIDSTISMVGTGGRIPAVYVPLCVSVVRQNTPAFAARDFYYAAVAQADGHTVSLVIEIFASTSEFPELVDQLHGFAQVVRWNASP